MDGGGVCPAHPHCTPPSLEPQTRAYLYFTTIDYGQCRDTGPHFITMASVKLGEKHDCYHATDPRSNRELAVALAGKNVLVTGGGRGVGRAIAIFLTHASAASLTVVALEQDELENTVRLCKEINPNLRTKAAALNVTDTGAVQKLIHDAERDFGGIDVLVCNAGRPPQWLAIDESDPSIWWDTVATSLQHAFLFTRFALPSMKKKKSGCIIYTASSGANANRLMGSYILGKLGQLRLAEIVHNENYKEFNIRCFAYNPGRVRTRFYTDFEDKVKGNPRRANSYVDESLANEDKSAQTAYNILHTVEWDTPELAAGLVTALAAGKLDFMSGRYIDASVDIAEYIENGEAIVEQDLHRVRLHAGPDLFIPRLDY
jgi:NAD(P)-dependent dehydrogenase (short-subunit alcohol dehydrogenase family)